MTVGDARAATLAFLDGRIRQLLAPTGYSFDVYSHGSYAKNTYVDPYGDIDIVVELCHPIVVDWRGGFVSAPGTPYGKVIKARPPTPEFLGFKHAVAELLNHDFASMSPGLGSMVRWGKTGKLLKVAPVVPGHVNADVLICQRFLDSPMVNSSPEQGVVFWDGHGELTASHPKKYIAKVNEKDTRTGGMFTALVRRLKANHLDLEHRGTTGWHSASPMRHIATDSSIGVSSATLEMLAYGVPNDRYSRRSLTMTRRNVRNYLRGVASTENSRKSFVPRDLINDTTYLRWIEFMHGGFRMLLSNDGMWR